MRRLLPLALALVVAAGTCEGAEPPPDVGPTNGELTASSTVTLPAPPTTSANDPIESASETPTTTGFEDTTNGTAQELTTSTTPAVIAGCEARWPEGNVVALLGSDFPLNDVSSDGSSCSYGSGPSTVVLSVRTGSRATFDQARTGAEISAATADVEACDGAWSVDLDGVLIAEGLDAADEVIFNVTASGIGPELLDDLLRLACG